MPDHWQSHVAAVVGVPDGRFARLALLLLLPAALRFLDCVPVASEPSLAAASVDHASELNAVGLHGVAVFARARNECQLELLTPRSGELIRGSVVRA